MTSYELFLSNHQPQLEIVPKALWPKLYQKLNDQTFDVGKAFNFTLNEDQPIGSKVSLLAAKNMSSHSDIFLIDHLWTFPSVAEAKFQLLSDDVLRKRVNSMLDPSPSPNDTHAPDEESMVERILRSMWLFTGSYQLGDRTFFYLLDEVGSALSAPRGGNGNYGYRCTLFFHMDQGCAYHIFWPEQEIRENEVVTCANLPNGRPQLVALQDVLKVFHHKATETTENTEHSVTDVKDLKQSIKIIHSTLLDRGYTVKDIGTLLHLPPSVGFSGQNLSGPAKGDVNVHLIEIEQETEQGLIPPLHDLVRLFLLGLPVPHHRVQSALGPSFPILLQCGLLRYVTGNIESETGSITSLAQFVPLLDDIILATDFFQTGGDVLGFDPVMYIGVDSLGLVASAPRHQGNHGNRVLDLCCGSGVQGIAALRLYGKTATCCDINPRAIAFSEFNYRLNGYEDSAYRVLLGDLYSVLERGKEKEGEEDLYDVILANPPYIPSGGGRGNLELFGDGGDDGERVLRRIIEGSQAHLATGGRLAIVGNLVNTDDYEEKMKSWWGCKLQGQSQDDRSCDFVVWHGKLWSPVDYAALVLNERPREDAEVQRYARGLTDCGVKHVTNGLIFGQADKRERGERGKGCRVEVKEGVKELWQEVTMLTNEGLDLVADIRDLTL